MSIYTAILLASVSGSALPTVPALDCMPGEVSEAGGSGGPADQLLQVARAGLRSAQQVCSEAGSCDPSFLNSLSRLQDRADALERAIPQGPDAIDGAIGQLQPVIAEVCSVLGGSSCTPLGGALNQPDPKPKPEPVVDPTTTADCYRGCFEEEGRCNAEAARAYSTCLAQWDQFIGCWQRVPYPGQPFPSWLRDEFNQNCQQFVQAGRLPPSRCACEWEERRGGCEQFFYSGQLCDTCSFRRCEDNPGIVCSCSKQGSAAMNWNFTQCDICRWFNLGHSLGNLSKGNFCAAPYYGSGRQCSDRALTCQRECYWR